MRTDTAKAGTSRGEATRRRILTAARDEFAAYGLGGARIDRIASEARASKERMYAYFGDKQALFDAVLEESLDRFLDEVPFDAEDVPEYAMRLFDHFVSEPEIQRMLLWGQLQGDGERMHRLGERAAEARIEAIGDAQDRGLIAPQWEPLDLATMVFAVVMGWVSAPGADCNLVEGQSELARRRTVVGEAVRRICAP
ncbi:TetR/AcrR family transcriptional regulator [Rhodococcus sp. D2-41]|uniref:TetR/AcrR family transcriptional regulator n=1 Tax=Speluncibacter jeojiensis TaxID=2710754 RepID=A0A9X4RIR1_9ACTN|nr:TetR/AcrR family transcriptional regulator [Rhodococcus sp. D2-41]MDG3009443.1 TetR/AcrR family transcriptional regulator [Rhodococcus sp. D2-41]MDG3016371.1 TetR/AcrR family transcriptional regulator [Corynebacteriales bacterium D3-21]